MSSKKGKVKPVEDEPEEEEEEDELEDKEVLNEEEEEEENDDDDDGAEDHYDPGQYDGKDVGFQFTTEEEEESAETTTAGGGGGDDTKADNQDEEVEDLLLNLTKKKKKKKKTDAELGGAGATDSAAEVTSGIDSWLNSDRDYNYTEMLERVFKSLREKNPNLAVRVKHPLPPPQLVRIGTRKTMWANFAKICERLHRGHEHIMSFVLAELGTEGAIDGNQRLVFKGRYNQMHIESLLKKYIVEYVTCHMCRNPETTLTRDPVTRLYFLQCESCGSRRSVAPIKSGYHATMRADRRKAKMG